MKTQYFIILFLVGIMLISGCSRMELTINPYLKINESEAKECTNDDFFETQKDILGMTWKWENYNLAFESDKVCEKKTCSKCKEYLNTHAERFFWEFYERESHKQSNLNFTILPIYNGNQTTIIETTSRNISYYIFIKNNENNSISCLAKEINQNHQIWSVMHFIIESNQIFSDVSFVRYNNLNDTVVRKYIYDCNIHYPNPEFPIGWSTEKNITITTIFK